MANHCQSTFQMACPEAGRLSSIQVLPCTLHMPRVSATECRSAVSDSIIQRIMLKFVVMEVINDRWVVDLISRTAALLLPQQQYNRQ